MNEKERIARNKPTEIPPVDMRDYEESVIEELIKKSHDLCDLLKCIDCDGENKRCKNYVPQGLSTSQYIERRSKELDETARIFYEDHTWN